MPNQKVADEKELLQRLEIDAVLTKESGHSGSLSVKIEAAQDLGLPIIILKRPAENYGFTNVFSSDALKATLVPLLMSGSSNTTTS